jgi:hypothetical protein
MLDDLAGLVPPAYFILRQGFLDFYHYCGFVHFYIQPVTFLLMKMYEWCGDQFRRICHAHTADVIIRNT